MLSSFLMHLALCFSLVLCHCATMSLGSSNATDQTALLSFKSVLSDPNSELVSWNTSNHQCDWRGVKCGRRQLNRVVALDLSSFHLSGHISPSLANLSFLRSLNLGDNQLHGPIPEELGHLFRLQVLNLSRNSLEGSIPTTLELCANLTIIDLGHNSLQGNIPTGISSLSGLTSLRLSHNNLSGEIPPSFGNVSNLYFLDLGYNLLSGSIPPSLGDLSSLSTLVLEINSLSEGIPAALGRLSSLTYLSLSVNNLSGTLPDSIWNMSTLIELHATHNHLFGRIPPNIGHTLPQLRKILLNYNEFYGPLPVSFANASNLVDIEFSSNLLSGKIPPELGSLRNFESLQAPYNFIEAKETEDWNFMTALTNCSNLNTLYLQKNRLRGVLPASIANLSITMHYLDLADNEFIGNIPVGIGNLVNLSGLWMAYNNLTGTIPSSLGMLKNLGYLNLSGNSLSGEIPSNLGNLTKISILDLGRNYFSGNIPSTIGNLKHLQSLNLSHNQLTGTIPKELVSIFTLSNYLDLSHNFLGGSIPSEVGNLQNLVEFHGENNRLSGEIPSSFGNCVLLRYLYLQDNFFQGNIPPSLSALKGIERLDLSNDNFSGEIPKFLENCSSLSYLNLSFNHLVGEVPTAGVFKNVSEISIGGNDKLCGGIQELRLPPCPSQKKHRFPTLLVVIPVLAILCLVLLICFFVARYKFKLTRRSLAISSLRGHIMISYSELVKATDGFSAANLIGQGSFGSVYRGTLSGAGGDDTAKIVAVKVLNLQTPGALRSFTAECESMRNLRHRNLVKIITLCSSIDSAGNYFRAIIFDYMPNGNLESWLHPEVNNQPRPKHLDLAQRVNIAFHVASALDYLHHYSAVPVVHCDLKPSNVLLDADMVAHVGDFGLAKILTEDSSSFQNQKSTSSIGFRGTIGYAAPEYGAGNRVSVEGDAYSYGILLLEMITGRKPTDDTFKDASLRKFVWMAVPDRIMDIVDENLVAELQDGEAANEIRTVVGRKLKCVALLLKVGLWCSEALPSERMATADIVRELHAVNEMLAGDRT